MVGCREDVKGKELAEGAFVGPPLREVGLRLAQGHSE